MDLPEHSDPLTSDSPASWSVPFASLNTLSSGFTTGCMICSKKDGLKQCVQCKLVYFCGQEHQRSHWPSHKAVCKKIARLRNKLEEKQKAASTPLDTRMHSVDVRESFAELTGGLSLLSTGSRRDGIHYKEQSQLAEQELEINTRVAVESALGHVIDLRNNPFRPLSDDVLEMATSCLIRLNRSQEAYNYLKHWTSRYKNHNILEPVDVFMHRAPSAAFLATVLLLKLGAYKDFIAARQIKDNDGGFLNPDYIARLKEAGIDDLVKRASLEPAKSLDDVITLLHGHVGKLYIQVKRMQPDFWSKLLTVYHNREPRRDNSGLETQPVLHCYRAFASNAWALDFLQDPAVVTADNPVDELAKHDSEGAEDGVES